MNRIGRLVESRDERSIGFVLLLGLESVLGWVLPGALAGTVAPERAVSFVALALVHGALIVAASFRAGGRWVPLYLAAQAALVWALVALAATPYALYLYATLGAQAVVLLYAAGRRAWLAVAFCEAAGFAQFIALWGWQDAPAFLFAAAPQAGFVAGFAALYMRQSALRREASARARALEEAQRRLAAYAEQVEDLTLSTERRRMARDLHDTLAQGLAGVILQLEAVEAQLAKGRVERAQAITQTAMTRARATMAEARQAIDDLRAGGSLAERIESEVRRFRAETGIRCTLDLDTPDDISDAAGAAAFRAVREGLSNVTRHAHATLVEVHAACADGTLRLSVRDNGIGIAHSAAEAQRGHYGLVGLRERARLAGGTLTVEPGAAGGTALTLRVPLGEVRDA